ncbi:tetratricopeptide repeat protein [Methylocystis suflitae]|uniref:tetratricopeptide repeat protein n=1 Tax=Methylocystis suflitae TaxID=2951405 RepID=UPI00210B80B5|nr:tetratricopeptide repeat protein [Methylocystis suflitae]MCQ4188610.1 tetratricopeptide repeat protein [Methylocystis suflitae]
MWKSAAVSLVLLAGVTSATRANDQALTNCTGADPNRVIAGCTELLARPFTATARAELYNARGKAYADKNQFDRAIKDLNEAIRLNPMESEAHYNRGLVYQSRGERDRAIADYSEAIRLNPQNFDAYYNRGAAYEAENKLRNALADYRKSLEITPGASDAIAAIARIKKKI